MKDSAAGEKQNAGDQAGVSVLFFFESNMREEKRKKRKKKKKRKKIPKSQFADTCIKKPHYDRLPKLCIKDRLH